MLLPRRRVFYSCLFLLGAAYEGCADNGWESHILTAREENDAPMGTDRHYTQGARLSYLSTDEGLPEWLKSFSNFIPAVGLEVQARKAGIAGEQDIFTPANLRSTQVIPNDRPYAGWLFATLSLQRRGEVSPACLAMETFGFEIGVIGPESLAQEAQETTHSVLLLGWNHQLGTEVGFNLTYDRRYLFRLSDSARRWTFDIIPSVLASGGTVATFLGLGTNLRFGYRIPNEFETPNGPTPFHYGAYLFTSAEGRAVARNIFLDGNTFMSSHHIDKQPFVAEFRAGLTFVLKRVEVTVAATLRTREFEGQPANDSYGTAMMTYKF